MLGSSLFGLSSFWMVADAFESIASKLRPEYQWSHSLYAPYISFDGNNNNWNFDALISMHDFIQLTPEIAHTAGSAFTKQITSEYAADGFAFWYVEEPNQPGSAFGQKEVFHGIGIFMDAFNNNPTDHSAPFPRVFAMVNDGSLHYDHDSDGGEQVVGGCHLDFLNQQVEGRVVLLHGTLEVSFKIEDGEWQQCLVIHGANNIPSSGYIGFSAANGEAPARNMLFSVTTGLLSDGTNTYQQRSPSLKSSKSATSFALVAFMVTGAIGGFYYYHQKQAKYHSI